MLIIQRVVSLNCFLQSSIHQNLGVASKVTTFAMDSTFFFADLLLHLQVVFRVAINNFTADVGYLLSMGCILYHLLFGSPNFHVDSLQINSLLSVFIYHCFHIFAMFTLLLVAFLALMLLILYSLGIVKKCERIIN